MSREKTPLERAVGDLEKKFGAGIIQAMGEIERVKPDVISTGSLALDMALGVGGVARRYLTEIWGPENAGKSTVCYNLSGRAIRDGGKVLLIDQEKKAQEKWIRQLIGVYGDVTEKEINENLYIARPEYGDHALDIAKKMVGKVDLIAIDSVASMKVLPRIEESDAAAQHPGLLARMLSDNVPILVGRLGTADPETGIATAMVVTNQLRYKIGAWGDPETRPGGMTIPHHAAVTIKMRMLHRIPKKKDPVVGVVAGCRVTKNQLAAPYRTAELRILFDSGFDPGADVFNAAEVLEIVKHDGGGIWSWKEDEGGFKIKGRENAYDLLREDLALREALRQAVLDSLG